MLTLAISFIFLDVPASKLVQNSDIQTYKQTDLAKYRGKYAIQGNRETREKRNKRKKGKLLIIQGVQKKIYHSFCLISVSNMLEDWYTIHMKGDIYTSEWSTKTFTPTRPERQEPIIVIIFEVAITLRQGGILFFLHCSGLFSRKISV